MKNYMGRPINPDAMCRTGQRFLLSLRKEESKKLRTIAKAKQITMSEVIRCMIKDYKETVE